MDLPRQIDRRAVPEGLGFTRWHTPDGWEHRAFAWTAEEPRGSLLFLGGRGDFVEKYIEALAHWHGAGWDLAGFDWRGQGGSGRFLPDPLICHLEDFDPLLDDLAGFVAEWTASCPAPHVIVAHSMGAHLTLRLLAERRPGGIAAAVLLAPMIELAVRPWPKPVVRLLSKAAVAAGRGERRLWEGDIGNVGGRMTSCPERQQDKIWWKSNRPELASGAPSWRWLRAACESIARLQHSLDTHRIETPLLMMASERDPVIDVAAVRATAARLPNARFRAFPGTGHELLREAEAMRLPVLESIDSFLTAAAPAR